MATGGFCFCKGELVECSTGRVQDCNIKQIHTCPLEEKKEESKSKEYGGFCFCKGELVDCIAGRVQDCNTKQVHTCPLEEKKEDKKKESKEANQKENVQYGGFCFCKGALVECSTGRVQDCNTKQIHKCPKEE